MKKMKLLVPVLTGIYILAGCSSDNNVQSDEISTMSVSETENQLIAGENETAETIDIVDENMTPIDGDNILDGDYEITVDSSSTMFTITSCILHAQLGKLTASMTMSGTGYLYLFMGTAQEAVDVMDSEYIRFTENENGEHVFTVPVEALDKGISCAAFSKNKSKWYDRTLVFRSDALPISAFDESFLTTASSLELENGEYTIAVTLEGGSGKASVSSPAKLTVTDGEAIAEIIWSSSNYDYMIVDGQKYEPVSTEEFSIFEIPVLGFDYKMPVSADTTAMSTPHEIEYTLYFDSSTITS